MSYISTGGSAAGAVTTSGTLTNDYIVIGQGGTTVGVPAPPQKYDIYNSGALAGPDYERFTIDWTKVGNVVYLGTEEGGAGAAREMRFMVGGTDAFRVDTSELFTISGGLNQGNISLFFPSRLQVIDDGTNWNASFVIYGAHTAPANNMFYKTRGATPTTPSAIQSGDIVSQFDFLGSDGTSVRECAQIQIVAPTNWTNAPATPGNILFRTNSAANGGAPPLLAATIGSDQTVTVGSFPNALTDGTSLFQVINTGGDYEIDALHYGNNGNAPALIYSKTRAGTPTGLTIVQNGDNLMYFAAQATDGAAYQNAVAIQAFVDGAPAANVMPGRLSFYTNPGGTSFSESQRLSGSGAIAFPRLSTTGSAANAFIDPASSPKYNLLQSTSSIRYKTDVRDISADRVAAVSAIRVVQFKSLCAADDPDKDFVGYIAEEVAEIDDALIIRDETGQPSGVQYDRVLLLKVEALERRIKELERAAIH